MSKVGCISAGVDNDEVITRVMFEALLQHRVECRDEVDVGQVEGVCMTVMND